MVFPSIITLVAAAETVNPQLLTTTNLFPSIRLRLSSPPQPAIRKGKSKQIHLIP